MNEVPLEDQTTMDALREATAGQDEAVAAYMAQERGSLPFTEVGREVLINALEEYAESCVESGWTDDLIEVEVLLGVLRMS